MKLIYAITAFLGMTLAAHAETMRLAVTTSFDNSGLADVLLPEIKADTGLNVQLLVVGTGQALRLGAAGDVDAVLVHSRNAEEQFIADGHGTHRREIMYNDFVIIGPATDPAGLRHAHDIRGAMAQLMATRAHFVSRGDDSGTHKAETRLWPEPVATFGPWYRAVGAGMGTALNTASAMGAYIMSDRASWLNFQNKGTLEVLFENDPALFNQYAFIPVNPAKGAHVRKDAVTKLEDWLTSDRAEVLINSYEIDGQQLFTFNANSDD